MTDIVSLINAITISNADEIYNLAAQSFVATSWEQPLATAEIDGIGVINMLEANSQDKAADSFLSGINIGDVWSCSGDSPERRLHLLPEKSLWCCKTIWYWDYEELSRELWTICLLRHSF